MKDAIKLALGLLKLGKKAIGVYRRERDAKRKKDIQKAVSDGDLSKLRKLILGK